MYIYNLVFNRFQVQKLNGATHHLQVPAEEPLQDRVKNIPYMIVDDDAFPLKPYLMKPYPNRNLGITQRVFNYRLSRVRRIVENVFGILTSRFSVFQKTNALEPDKDEKVVLAACVLHNFLRSKPSSMNIYSPPDYIDRENQEIVIDAEWRQNAGNCLPNILQQGGNRSTLEAREIRDKLCDYFNTNGEVPWQWDAI